ncbi:MAG: glutamate--tRNA ligase [Acidobacteria bacterium]|nr:glutamate--tRNA ligase [Acidobacteriota bacterium]
MPARPVRVRFAPSPTGFLHVGGARTALFNWLYARKEGGTFVLRIEDTDLARSSDEMTQAILDGLSWLGLAWDEGPFLQSLGRADHVARARRLVAAGKAYACWCDPATLDAKRKEAEGRGQAFKYDRTCARLDAAERARHESSGSLSCVRLMVPEGTTAYDDLVHGPVSFENTDIEDLVLLRSDGSPTYNLSCVADDVDMKITHVIRGDDHISNTPKQILLYRALGLEEPRFGHLPLILGDDKKRLSKRHGAVSVTEYRRMGYLPEVLFNFLALLGWSPGGDREIMTRDEMVSLFSFEGVNPRSAVFDHDKLDWMNGQYLSRLPGEAIFADVKEGLVAVGLWRAELEAGNREWMIRLIETLKTRSRKVSEVVVAARPFLTEDFSYDDEAARKHFGAAEAADRLDAMAGALGAVAPWGEASLEASLRALGEKMGVAAAKLIHPARVALTGSAVSPGIFEVMALMGRDGTVARLKRAAAFVREHGLSPGGAPSRPR